MAGVLQGTATVVGSGVMLVLTLLLLAAAIGWAYNLMAGMPISHNIRPHAAAMIASARSGRLITIGHWCIYIHRDDTPYDRDLYRRIAAVTTTIPVPEDAP